jgi:hypothetical protein
VATRPSDGTGVAWRESLGKNHQGGDSRLPIKRNWITVLPVLAVLPVLRGKRDEVVFEPKS